MNLITEQFIKVNGQKMGLDTDEVCRSGKTGLSTKVNGKRTWRMEEGD